MRDVFQIFLCKNKNVKKAVKSEFFLPVIFACFKYMAIFKCLHVKKIKKEKKINESEKSEKKSS